MQIPMTLSEDLLNHFESQGIKPEDYKPAYGGESVGLDLYCTKDTIVSGTQNHEGDKVLIPTGVRLALPKSYVAFIKDRGSISKTGYVRRAGVIDPGYTGEIFVNLASLRGIEKVKAGEKLPVQLVVVKAETDFKPVSTDEFEKLTVDAKRGEGKTGSSD